MGCSDPLSAWRAPPGSLGGLDPPAEYVPQLMVNRQPQLGSPGQQSSAKRPHHEGPLVLYRPRHKGPFLYARLLNSKYFYNSGMTRVCIYD